MVKQHVEKEDIRTGLEDVKYVGVNHVNVKKKFIVIE